MMDISIVIPAFNEEGNITSLHGMIDGETKKSEIIGDYEIIFVDDGSTDSTLREMEGLVDKNARIIREKNRAGQSAALRDGIAKAKYPIIVTMDADLQNDPADIDALLWEIEKGADFVCGWRRARADPTLKIFSSKI